MKRERETGFLLAVSVLQVKMWVEVDEDFLPGLRCGYDPHAELGGRVGAGVTRGGQVVRRVDHDLSAASICTTKEGGK